MDEVQPQWKPLYNYKDLKLRPKSTQLLVTILKDFVLSSIVLQTSFYIIISVVYSHLVIFVLPLVKGLSYDKMRTFLSEDFQLREILNIINIFSAFFIIAGFQSGENTFKFIWKKYESICNSVGTYTNAFIAGIHAGALRVQQQYPVDVKQFYSLEMKTPASVQWALFLLSVQPYIIYYTHVRKFTTGSWISKRFGEWIYGSFYPLVIVLHYFGIHYPFNINSGKFLEKIKQIPDYYYKQLESKFTSFKQKSGTHYEDENDLLVEFVYQELKRTVVGLRDKQWLTLHEMNQLNLIQDSVIAANGEIFSTVLCSRSKPQTELSVAITVGYFLITPFVLIPLIPNSIKWTTFIFSGFITYFIAGLTIAGNRLRHIFDFRSFQRPYTFKKHARETSRKINGFSETFFRGLSNVPA